MPSEITDLFAGVGTFALPLAEQAEVHAVEGDAAMIAALDKGWRQAEGLKLVTVETRDLFRRPLEPDEFKSVRAVVIDPPRAGAEAQTNTLAVAQVPVIAFVSCNPVTFARDAKTLISADICWIGCSWLISSAGLPMWNLSPAFSQPHIGAIATGFRGAG